MSDITPAQAATPEPQVGDGKADETVAQEQPNTGQASSTWTLDAALAEIKKLNAESAKYRVAAKQAEKAKADAEAAALAEQGEFKKLYEQAQAKLAELEPAQAKLDELIAAAQAANQKRVDALPDAMKSLVPDYDDPLKLAAWLDANSAVFQKQPAPVLDGKAGGAGGGAAVDEAALKAQAVRLGLNPDLYVQAQKQSAGS